MIILDCPGGHQRLSQIPLKERGKGRLHTHTHTHAESDVEMEQTEIGVMQPQVKECQQPLMLEEARSGFSLISVQ